MGEKRDVHEQQNGQHYSLLIEWSEQDQAYIVSFPEWEQTGHIVHVHGVTYEQAIDAGQEMLIFLIQTTKESGEELPEPRAYTGV